MAPNHKDKPTRNTIGQQIVLAHLKQVKKPETLEEIHKAAMKKVPRIAFSTVYRIVKSLEEKRLVERIDWRDRGSRYELVGTHHHHLVCQTCGTVQDIEDADISLNLKKIARKTGFVLKAHMLELTGVCERCAKEYY